MYFREYLVPLGQNADECSPMNMYFSEYLVPLGQNADECSPMNMYFSIPCTFRSP